jgi:hypothetical protein
MAERAGAVAFLVAEPVRVNDDLRAEYAHRRDKHGEYETGSQL